MKKQLIVISLLFIAGGANALDIAKAYKMIPHQQTSFYLQQSRLPAAEAKYVAKLLSLSELAMAERVEAMADGPRKSNYDRDIADILNKLARLKTPTRLLPAYKHVVSAVQQHREVFSLQVTGAADAQAKQQQLVQSSHRHLIAAYDVLMQLYPDETRHNKQAFFDYLCALDFI